MALGGGVEMAAIAVELEGLPALRPGLPLDWLAAEPWRGAAGGDPGTDRTVDPACAGGPPSWPESSTQRSERTASGASASTSLSAAQYRPASAGRRSDEVRVTSRGIFYVITSTALPTLVCEHYPGCPRQAVSAEMAGSQATSAAVRPMLCRFSSQCGPCKRKQAFPSACE